MENIAKAAHFSSFLYDDKYFVTKVEGKRKYNLTSLAVESSWLSNPPARNGI